MTSKSPPLFLALLMTSLLYSFYYSKQFTLESLFSLLILDVDS